MIRFERESDATNKNNKRERENKRKCNCISKIIIMVRIFLINFFRGLKINKQVEWQ